MSKEPPEQRACREGTDEEKRAIHEITVRRAMYAWVGWPVTGRVSKSTQDTDAR